jgi:membrane protein implicated in regulation of membrane protease activity
MKGLGFSLLCAGFLAGAYATALDVQEVWWQLFAVAVLAAFAGLVILKRQARTESRSSTVLELNRSELLDSINNVVNDLRVVTLEVSLKGEKLRDWIDDKLRNDLQRFADARESMVHLFGLQAYADIMSSFAAGERYINRVWSASADGYDVEAAKYLDKAAQQFAGTQEQLSAISSQTAAV